MYRETFHDGWTTRIRYNKPPLQLNKDRVVLRIHRRLLIQTQHHSIERQAVQILRNRQGPPNPPTSPPTLSISLATPTPTPRTAPQATDWCECSARTFQERPPRAFDPRPSSRKPQIYARSPSGHALLELGERDRGGRRHEGLKQAVELRQRAGDAMLRKIPNKIMQIHAVRDRQGLEDGLYVPEETQDVQTDRLRQGLQRGVVWRGQNKTSFGASAVREGEEDRTYNRYRSLLHSRHVWWTGENRSRWRDRSTTLKNWYSSLCRFG